MVGVQILWFGGVTLMIVILRPAPENSGGLEEALSRHRRPALFVRSAGKQIMEESKEPRREILHLHEGS